MFSYENGSVSVVLSNTIPEPATVASVFAVAALVVACCVCRRRSAR